MKKNIFKILFLALSLLLIMMVLAACAGSNRSDSVREEADYGYYDDDSYDAYSNSASGSASGSSGGSSGSSSKTAEKVTDNNRKIIESYSYTLETKTYDDFVNALEAKVKELKGYIAYQNSYSSSSSGYLSGSYEIKIPSEKKDNFVKFVKENAHIYSSSIDTEDVTLTYIDVESRIKSLKLEQESLEKLLKEADSVTDIIDIQSRLSDVIYEIESYESQLRTLDADIDYTSFSLSVREVERESPVIEDTLWQKIGKSFFSNLSAIGEFFEDLFVGFVGLTPFWILFGVMGLIALLIVKLSLRHSRKKREKAKKNPPVRQNTPAAPVGSAPVIEQKAQERPAPADKTDKKE